MKQRSAGVVWGIKVMGAPLFRFLSDIFSNNNSGTQSDLDGLLPPNRTKHSGDSFLRCSA